MAKRKLVMMALVLVAMTMGSASASANYYGIATLQGSNFHGTDVTIRSNNLFVSNVFQDFADNDNWDVSDSNAQYWVEAGRNINVGGWTGTSTSNINGAGMIETGTEVTTQSATVCSSQSNLQWWDQSGGLHSGWSDSTGNAGRTTSNPPYATWVSPQSWLRDYANISC